MDGDRQVKRVFLILYDYGQGGIWAFLKARSKEDIADRYPELEIHEALPEWMSPQEVALLRERMTFDVDEPPRDFLATLVAARGQGTGSAATHA
jgi:hypothetical protein